MSLTLTFIGTGRASDGPTGVLLISISLSPSPAVVHLI